MASLCARCGTALSPSELICPSCGAATGAGGAVAVFVPPTAAEKKPGMSTLKIVLIVIAVVVGLGILGLGAVGFIGYRIMKNTHVDSSGRMTMNTPAGTITTTPVENVSAADLGVDIYPGAQSTRGSMKMEMPNGSSVTGVFLASDPPAQVAAFYKDKLGPGATVTSFLGNTIVKLKKGPQEFIQVTITANSSLDSGKTRMTIMHMMHKPS